MLIGTYTFIRHIDDRYAHKKHTASGILTITETKWVENGTLHSLNESDFYQNYGVQFDDGALCVYYPNGNIFYTLADFQGTHNIKHQCGADVYMGSWIYENPILTLQWIVKGPRKNYTMHTTYTKNI